MFSVNIDPHCPISYEIDFGDPAERILFHAEEKNADLIVLNSLKDQGAGFGHNTNKVSLFFKDGKEKQIGLKSKSELAKDIVDSIIEIKK